MSYYLDCSQELSQQNGTLHVDLRWSMHEGCAAVDLDVSAVCFSSKGALVDAAYYNQLDAVNGAVVHGGDCRGKDKSHKAEDVKISLDRVEGVAVIVFLVSAFTNGCLEACDSATCKVLHGKDVLATMSNTRAQMGTSSSMMLFMLFKHPDTNRWCFVEIRKAVQGRHFHACLTKIRHEVDMVIDPGSSFERCFSDDKTFQMEKGDQLNVPLKVHKLLVGLGWTPKQKGVEIDLDASCVMLTRNSAGQLTPFDLANGEEGRCLRPGVQHMGDNTTGEGEGDDEEIIIDLAQVEACVDALVIVVTVFNQRSYSFGDIHDSYVRLVDYESDHVYAKFTLGGSLVKTGVVFCLLERGASASDPWTLVTVGEEVDGKTARFVKSNLWEGFLAYQGQVTSQAEGCPALFTERKPRALPSAAPGPMSAAPAVAVAPAPAADPEETITSTESASCLPDWTDMRHLLPTPPAATEPAAAIAADLAPADGKQIAGELSAAALAASPVVTKPRKVSTGPVMDCLAESEELARQEGSIQVSLDWTMKLSGRPVDLDASAVCFSSTGTLVDAAYYNQLSAVGGAVTHSGDYKCGEKINIDLSIGLGVRIIVFVVSAYSGGDLSSCESTTCTVTQNGTELASMVVTAQPTASSMLLCMLFKHPETQKWHFSEVRHSASGRHFTACLRSLRAVVDQVIDEGLIYERNLSTERVFNMEKCDQAVVPPALHRVLVGLGWTAKADTIDLDATCIMLVRNADGQLTPFDLANGEKGRRVRPGVQHMGDNTTGHGEGDDEQILIDLTAVEQNVAALAIVVTNVHSQRTFKDVTNSYVCVMSEGGTQTFAKFALGDSLTMPAVVFCLLERGATAADPWTLVTIGEEVKGRSGRFVISKLWEGYYAEPGQRISSTPATAMVAESLPEPDDAPAPVPAAAPSTEPAGSPVSGPTPPADAPAPKPAENVVANAPLTSETSSSVTPPAPSPAAAPAPAPVAPVAANVAPTAAPAAPAISPTAAKAPPAARPAEGHEMAQVVGDNSNAACCVIS